MFQEKNVSGNEKRCLISPEKWIRCDIKTWLIKFSFWINNLNKRQKILKNLKFVFIYEPSLFVRTRKDTIDPKQVTCPFSGCWIYSEVFFSNPSSGQFWCIIQKITTDNSCKPFHGPLLITFNSLTRSLPMTILLDTIGKICCYHFTCNYQKKQTLFITFLFHFWNLH